MAYPDWVEKYRQKEQTSLASEVNIISTPVHQNMIP